MDLFAVLSIITFIIVVIFCVIYAYFHKQYQYWKKKNVKFIRPKFPSGNMGTVNVTETINELFYRLYNQSINDKFVGIWMMFKPTIMINDPELIKHVLIKDFQHFQDRGAYVDTQSDPLSDHILFKTGSNWRNMRVKLTPAFTSGKMKHMFHLLAQCENNLVDYLKVKADNKEIIEMKDLLARSSTDVIALCAFGLEVNSVRDPDCMFRQMGRKLTEFNTLNSLKFFFVFFVPELASMFRARFTPKAVEKFFSKTFRETIDYRQQNNIKRNDFVQMMMQLMNKGYVEDADAIKSGVKDDTHEGGQKFTFNEAAAHAVLFYLGGFETSATVLQFSFYELALNPELQEDLRREIDEMKAKYNDQITYEGIHEIPLLDGVVSETLRKYPPGGILSRLCTKNYKIPDSDVVIEAGTILTIPVYGLHHDPKYYPEPHVFNPHRFTPEEKAKRNHFVYMPFGEGPRNCIGNRFALMQIKAGLAWLLSHYKFEVCEETSIPVEFEPKSMTFTAKGGMKLRISHRNV